MTKILMIDNYDSFTYNLVHYLEDLNRKVIVVRNDQIELEEVKSYDKIILSPGPGLPDQAGILSEIIETYAPQKSILGICLGHQAIAEVFGGTLIKKEKTHHGVATQINITEPRDPIFMDLPNFIEVGRYHSWEVNPENFPENLKITSVDNTGTIMSLSHKIYDVKGVQFHPESILTPNGKKILENWLRNSD
ncbi:MAG: aminodeoxychorismate/anthranilate synthase component II [Flavobacteriaceae bacterium]|jgi:anthranilate synthase component 2|nr:aminodeoxychorismate/anthranilate synthase component II [Flavobacteriaceae bacterium]